MTGCRFVQFADSYTWIFQACTYSLRQLKRNQLHWQLHKQPCHSFSMHVCAWLVEFSRCRRLFSTTNVTVFLARLKFRNHAALAAQHSLPILIIDGEKIILLYATFTYISSHCQKYLQISILWAETGSLGILFNSIMFKIVYGKLRVTRYTNCFEVLVIFVCL